MIKEMITRTKLYAVLAYFIVHTGYVNAQFNSYGNTFVHSSSELAIHAINHSFDAGGFAPMDGIIGTERVAPRGYVGYVNSASWFAASDAKHIDGYVRTYMTGQFVFPIGDNGKFRPCAVSTSSLAQPTNAAYYRANPSVAVTSSLKGGNEPPLPNGTTYNTTLTDIDVKNVSTIEYWDINGLSGAKITLTWDASSGVAAMTGGNLSKLTIVGWNGAKWVVIPSNVDNTSILGGLSTLSGGSITTTSAITPNDYDIYTIAISCPVTTPTNLALSKNTVCAGATIVLSATSGDTLKWYKDAALTQLVGIGNNLTITPSSSTRYFAAQVSGVCVSSAISDSVTIVNNCPPFPVLDTTLKNPAKGVQVAIGPVIPTPTGGSISATIIGGFYHRAVDSQYIDPLTGQVKIIPNDTPFVGQDTLIRQICYTVGGFTTCDTSLIIIDNNPPNKIFRDTTWINIPKGLASLPALIFEGGTPTITTSSPRMAVTSGVPTYKPALGFIGIDTQYIYRCDGAVPANCDTTKYIIVVLPNLKNNVRYIWVNTFADTIGPAIYSSKNVSDIATAKNGSVVKNVDGTWKYIPSANFLGLDTVVRIVCMTVPPKCDTQKTLVYVAPHYPDTFINVAQGASVTASTPVKAMGGSTTDVSISKPSHGTAIKNQDGTVTYTPTLGFSGLDTVIRIVCVTYADKTSACDTAWIVYEVNGGNIEIPNYISPSGDGLNDVWNLDALLLVHPNSKVIIYNRWGNIVWRSTGAYAKSTSASNVWYGQLEGSQAPVPDGVYYYLIELEDNFRTTKTGFIEVMRQ